MAETESEVVPGPSHDLTVTKTVQHKKPSASKAIQAVDKSVQTEFKARDNLPRCEYCGIIFEDDIISVIHQGCHTRVNPFQCNICGHQSENRHGFYSHITRGHISS